MEIMKHMKLITKLKFMNVAEVFNKEQAYEDGDEAYDEDEAHEDGDEADEDDAYGDEDEAYEDDEAYDAYDDEDGGAVNCTNLAKSTQLTRTGDTGHLFFTIIR